MNDNSVSLYKFHNNEIRVVMQKGEPWFVAADVCRALGMATARGVSPYLTSLNKTEKQVVNQNILDLPYDIRRGNPNLTLISESGLYKLVMRSDKPEARQFQDWVTRDVLPAIRKDGAYIKGEEKVGRGEMEPEITVLKFEASEEDRPNQVVPTPPFGANQPLTMSSREIADLTGKEHRNVMRDIRVMLVELYGEGGVLKFEHTHLNTQNGQTYPIFRLPKRETMILVSGYSIPLRAAIVDRWQELEEQVRKPVFVLPNFEDPSAAARAWADERDGRIHERQRAIEAEERLAEAAPKVEVYEDLVNAEGLFNIRTALSKCCVREREGFDWLRKHRWIGSNENKRVANLPTAKAKDRGYFTIKTRIEYVYGGKRVAHAQPLVTPKGLAWMTKAMQHLRREQKEAAE